MKIYLRLLSLAFCFVLPVAFAEDSPCVNPPSSCQIDSKHPDYYSCPSKTKINLSKCILRDWNYQLTGNENYSPIYINITKSNKNYVNYICQQGWLRPDPSSQVIHCR